MNIDLNSEKTPNSARMNEDNEKKSYSEVTALLTVALEHVCLSFVNVWPFIGNFVRLLAVLFFLHIVVIAYT